MTRWEYKTAKVVLGAHATEKAIDQVLARHGNDGWEVVSSFDTDAGGGVVHHLYFVMKRPLAA